MEWKRKSAKGIGYHLLQLQVRYWSVILFSVEHYCELTAWPSRYSRVSLWYLAIIVWGCVICLDIAVKYCVSSRLISQNTLWGTTSLRTVLSFLTLKMMQVLIVMKWPCHCRYTIHPFPKMCNKYAVPNIPTLKSGMLCCLFQRKKHAVSNLFYFRKPDQHGFDLWIWPACFVWSRRLWCFVSR